MAVLKSGNHIAPAHKKAYMEGGRGGGAMTPQTMCDEQALMREQREEAERIPKTASEEGKKPTRKPDTPDAA